MYVLSQCVSLWSGGMNHAIALPKPVLVDVLIFIYLFFFNAYESGSTAIHF